MLKNILKHVIKKSKKSSSLTQYRYSEFMKQYGFHKNFHVDSLSGMVNGINNDLLKARRTWKRQRLQNVRQVKFRKFFFKTLIEGRSLVKLVLRKQYKRKTGLSNLISASAHTTFFQRLHNLEFTLFNVVLRSHFTTSLKDAFLWIKGGLVFVNNTPAVNPYMALSLGDRIQLTMTNRYFIYKKSHHSRTRQDIAKLRSAL